MFNLEEELVIGSERVPWVMWIQLLVMLLLLIILYHLLAFSLGIDLSPNSSAAAPTEAAPSSAAASSSRFHAPKPSIMSIMSTQQPRCQTALSASDPTSMNFSSNSEKQPTDD